MTFSFALYSCDVTGMARPKEGRKYSPDYVMLVISEIILAVSPQVHNDCDN